RCLGVDGSVVRIDPRIEVDLGLRDVKEAPRFAIGALARLRAREHVIGRRKDFSGTSRRGTQSTEGLNERQERPLYRDNGTPSLIGAGNEFNLGMPVHRYLLAFGRLDFVPDRGLAQLP